MWIRRGLTKTYEAEKPLSICMCTTSHEILHTVELCSFCKAGKIAMQDIYTSSVETKYIIICIWWWGDFNCWNSKCKMFNSLSQICISSKKSVSLAQFANRTQNSPLITKWFEKIMSYVLIIFFFFALWFSSNEK